MKNISNPDNFSELEKSVETLVDSFRALIAGSESVVSIMEGHLTEIRSGRAKIEAAMEELQEKHAKFTKDSSAAIVEDASKVINRLTGEISQFMDNNLFMKAKKPEGGDRQVGDGGHVNGNKPTEGEND